MLKLLRCNGGYIYYNKQVKAERKWCLCLGPSVICREVDPGAHIVEIACHVRVLLTHSVFVPPTTPFSRYPLDTVTVLGCGVTVLGCGVTVFGCGVV